MPSRETRWWRHHQAAITMRRVRKQIKHNREPKRTRRKHWMPEALDNLGALDDLNGQFDDVTLANSERIMPRGERERRQATLKMALAALDEEAESAKQPSPAAGLASLRGTVVEVSSGLCRVDLGPRKVICSVLGSLSAADTGFTNVVAVGDEVLLEEDSAGRGVVKAVLPRRSALVRPDVFLGHLQQVIVANAEQLLIVASWQEPALWLELVDRYLIAGERNRLLPTICVNKIDLAEDTGACRAALRPYLDLGYRVVFTSAVTGLGVTELREVLRGHMTVLAGLSGVGKSSLLAEVQPGLQSRIAEVSEYHRAGRHTTTQVNLWKLEMGGFVVDTPGIREFGLSGLRKRELKQWYPEIQALANGCRFPDCSHTREPRCAVRAAVEASGLSRVRYENYRKIYAELPD